MLRIYAFNGLPPFAIGFSRDLRVLWAAEEMGIPYEIKGINAMEGQQDTPEHRAVQPYGQLPAIEDDGLTLFESGSILAYLAEKSGKLRRRAR